MRLPREPVASERAVMPASSGSLKVPHCIVQAVIVRSIGSVEARQTRQRLTGDGVREGVLPSSPKLLKSHSSLSFSTGLLLMASAGKASVADVVQAEVQLLELAEDHF